MSESVRKLADGKILAEVRGVSGIITFNQPEKRNAISAEMWSGVADILAEWENDPAVRVVVLTGAGDKAFVSGADISQFESCAPMPMRRSSITRSPSPAARG